MNDQVERYNTRRQACTLPDGTRPYGWWKRYQQHIGGAKTITEAEIQREAARLAKAQTARTGGDENDSRHTATLRHTAARRWR